MRNPEGEKFIHEEESSSQEKEKKLFELMDKAERAETTPEKTKILKEMKRVAEGREVKEFISIEEAKEILGQENVLGLEDVEKCFLRGAELDEKPGEIPYSRKELEVAKKWGEMLVLRSPWILEIEGIFKETTIEGLGEEFPGYFSKQKEWLKDMEFFHDDKIEECEWKLVKKKPTMLGRTYLQQRNEILEITKPGSYENVERRRPVEIIYDTILYWLKNGKPPFENMSDWSSEKLSSKKIVRVGVERESVTVLHTPTPGRRKIIIGRNKIVIGSNHPDRPRDNLGVCPQR